MEKKQHPKTGLWATKSGTGHSVGINEKVLAVLQTAKLGGRLYLKAITDTTNEKSPAFDLVVFPPSENKASFGL